MERYKKFSGCLIPLYVKQFILVFVFCFSCFLSSAQNGKDNIPLHNYLRQHFDTTIILDVLEHFGISPEYYIIALKDDKINTFIYKWPMTNELFTLRLLPDDLAKKYTSQLLSYQKTLPDTNIYFLPYSASRFKKQIAGNFISAPLTQVLNIESNPSKRAVDSLLFALPMVSDLLKRSIDSLQLWNITGDETGGRGCPENTHYSGIQPYDTYVIWLITQNDTRKLYFYEPGYFENLCPGRIGRQQAVRLIKLVNTAFRR